MNRYAMRYMKRKHILESTLDEHRLMVNMATQHAIERKLDLIDAKIERGVEVGEDLRRLYELGRWL